MVKVGVNRETWQVQLKILILHFCVGLSFAEHLVFRLVSLPLQLLSLINLIWYLTRLPSISLEYNPASSISLDYNPAPRIHSNLWAIHVSLSNFWN